MASKRKFSPEEAQRIGNRLGINWEEIPLEEFRTGLAVELEQGTQDPETNVTNDDELAIGKIALAHLKEFPDYYTRLEVMEEEADSYWEEKKKETPID